MISDREGFAVVVLAAGKGKRMNNPNMSKVMALLDAKPLIFHVLSESKLLSPALTIVIVGHQKESVIDYIGVVFPDVMFEEQNEQKGTGHAVMQTAGKLRDFNGNVLILSGDVPLLSSLTMQEFINNHIGHGADLSVLSSVAPNPYGYGRIVRDADNSFLRIVEEKDAADNEKLIDEINSGVYFVKAPLLFEALESVSDNNAQGEYYLTDIIEILHRQGCKVIAYPGAVFEELQGVNSPEDLERVNDYYKKRKLD
jgi:bifunctional UDP-N-acetylglucosamine pyrophosphorylase/glucosamine-1-phosphate N-acetyltransferase